jgi:adenosylcobinamide-GDP ribazoletransferase
VRELFGLLALLSRIRFSRSRIDLESAARKQFLFPAAGAVIGIIFTLVAFLAFNFLDGILDGLIISLLVVIFIYFLTGLIHLEGLADFGDGLMASGDKERKKGAMKDVAVGASGTFFMIIAVLMLVLLVRDLGPWVDSPPFLLWADRVPFVLGLVVAEVGAKLAMNTVMAVGPSSHQGMGSVFVEAATPGRYVAALAIGIAIALFACGLYGLIVLLGPIAGIVIAVVARKHFGGVGGDSFGAANEVGRLLILFTWVVLL